jgi:chemosensory pili system protein ChpA (sensor histidine kinase/response regulator)
MTKPPYNKVFLTLFKEVKEFLTEMEKLILLLKDENNDKEPITNELHGLTSTIMGVSSMMNLDELTNTSALINRIIDDILKGKLHWSPRLIDVLAGIVPQINMYCSSLETQKELDDTLYQKTLSAFSEFDNSSTDSSDENDSQGEEFEDDFFDDISFDDDSDDDLDDDLDDHDIDITDEDEMSSDISSEKAIFEMTDSEMTDIDPEFLESFNEESEEHLSNISQQLNLIGPSINGKTDISDKYREILHSIRRSVHTLKGAAAVIGIKSVASYGNEFEDFLDWLHDESDTLSPEIITIMLDGTDILEKLAINPVIKIDNEIDKIKNTFESIMNEKIHSVDADEDTEKLEENSEDDFYIDFDMDTSDDNNIPTDITSVETASETAGSEMTDIEPEFLESFNEESKDHFNNINEQLNLLSPFIKDKTAIFDGYRVILHSIKRSVHTLKGAAAVVGIESVASFGNEFEDFLDWLYDESDILSPEIIAAMLDATDILERLAINPVIKIDNEIDEIKNTFETIIADVSEAILKKEKKTWPESVDTLTNQPNAEQIKTTKTINVEKEDIPSDIPSKTANFRRDDSRKTVIDPEFLESFNEESKDHLNNIGLQLNLLSPFIKDKTNISNEYREKLHSIRRSVHTLKGAAAVIGIKSVASFGDKFEDFLDWLHDESDSLSPEIITGMLDGTDILERLSINPEIEIENEIDEIKNTFEDILADSSIDTDNKEQVHTITIDADKKQKIVPLKTIKPIEQREIARVKTIKTLRVEMGKVDQMIGLIGDMTINISSYEDSSQFLQATLMEFDNTIKRINDITLNLETGFELTTIPHLNAVSGSTQDGNQTADEFDPLEMDRYSDIHIMIRSLHEAIADLSSIKDQTIKVQTLWLSTMGRQQRVINEIQNSMQLIKMAPFLTLSNRLYKTVRESARVTKKSVQLGIDGGSMEMDTHVWNVLADPLMHLLRNSIDHGIEKPEDRKKANKPEQATILIKIIRRGSWMNMHFSDDGKGLDYDAIRKKASTLYPKKEVSAMGNDDLTALIFKQGFSIKEKATTMSGRGVGMDVVDHAVKQLNGNIEVISTPGKGIEFIIRLPIEVAQLSALLVKFGQQDFAVPLRDINRIFKINKKQSTKIDFKLDNTILPLLKPTEILGLKPMQQPFGDQYFALSVDVGSENAILVTDSIIGRRDVVFKSLGPHLHNKVPCVAGATIMGNGNLIPILNTEELFLRKKLSASIVDDIDIEIDKPDQDLKILIVDDSISIRKVLTNFISNQGWQPSVAKDGVDAMEMIRQFSYDLILLDIEMPRMNGFDVLQSLQLHLDYSNIPVLMLTSRSAMKYKNRAIELGAKGFVTKPFKNEELLSLINSLVKPDLSTKKLKAGK